MQVPELVVDFMNRLQPVGICFALDNFGAGQTALRHLRDLCFDMVKIDGQFIKGIADNPDNQVLVSAMKAFADQFDMMTIAEQVESANEAQFVAQLGIDCSQGYFYAAPTTQPSWATKTTRYA
jgi:EAL domain-containing protein (putative c-di-GMP-specific phosphodiesterase class I)